MTSKFIQRVRDPGLSAEALEGAKSAWVLHVLNFEGTSYEEHSVGCLLSIGMREYLSRVCVDTLDQEEQRQAAEIGSLLLPETSRLSAVAEVWMPAS